MTTKEESSFTMWSIIYGIIGLLSIWLFARFIIWQIAGWVKAKFDVDITIKSIGLFSVNDITVRVNQLQTIEIDKIALQLNLFKKDASHLVALHFGELRVRAEMKTTQFSPGKDDSNSESIPAKRHRRSGSFAKRRDTFIKFIQRVFKCVSLHIDVLNIMLLHAFVPDSLLHVNIQSIHLASENSVSSADDDSEAALTGSLSVKSIEGKILKSPKEASEVTSCIAEVSSALEIAVLAKQLYPVVELTSVNIDLSKLQVDIHEGALIPGIFLPQIKPENFNRSSQVKDATSATEKIEQIQATLLKIIHHFPVNSIICVRSFGLAFFGDETMGETTRGAHVCSSRIMLRQFKDTANMVPIVIEKYRITDFKVPSGYIRLQVEDVTMTDYYKHKVADMGKTVFESKLTPNGALSNSFDFTSWHADYMHKESVEFWSIIVNKLYDAQLQKAVIQQTMMYSKMQEQVQQLNLPIQRRGRTVSALDATNQLSHPDILQGTENAAFVDTSEATDGHGSLNITDVIKAMDISVLFECTIYDASMNALMSPVSPTTPSTDSIPSFTIGLDSFTGSIDQSPHSRDLNFMSKMEHFWCMVSQDGAALLNSPHDINSANNRHSIHQWGRAFNIENLGLHGSASFKSSSENSPSAMQEVSLLIDAKVAGLQLEISKRAAQALASLLEIVLPSKPTSSVDDEGIFRRRPTYQRQVTTPEGYVLPSRSNDFRSASSSKYHYTIACVELELSRVNAFVLSSDETCCADCFVARFDQLKAEISGGDSVGSDGDGISRSISVAGVAVTTVHNPSFSAFASYEAGLSGGWAPAAKVPASMRQQQTRAAEYQCVSSASMVPNYVSFDVLEVCYLTKYVMAEAEEGFDPEDNDDNNLADSVQGRVRRQLTVMLNSEADIQVRWTPALHALVHYEIIDFAGILSPFFKKKKDNIKWQPQLSAQRKDFTNDGDHSTQQASQKVKPHLKVNMFGDGLNEKKSPASRCLELDVNISTVYIHFGLSETQYVQFCLSPLRCLRTDHMTNITFDDLYVVMDDHTIFTFSNNSIELSPWNETCQTDRKSFTDLKTSNNRTWSFKITSVKCYFPYKYDFADTFDKAITVFKWVKGLYRKTSHPFRSSRLPPDLLISITQFIFEMGDWNFECHLRDNHELMMDEWTESEKRRRVLDQRMAELRRKRGEILPAKKVEELYCQLAETNISIYLVRSRKMYSKPCTSTLLTWSLTNFKVSVLADESMHGMTNAMQTIKSIDDVSPFPFKNEQDDDPEFVTLWCRCICLHASRHQVRIRNYPQCLMDYSDWKIYGKFCAAEQKGIPSAKRTEYVQLPAPWGPAEVLRNMPALKFYHDLSSEVHIFNMAWGPCWDPGWSQVGLAMNLLTKMTVDPSPQLPWWDKSRLLFHGRLAMSMDRVNLLHLASLDPYNTTEHMHWDWKNLYMDWTPGSFLFKGDLDIHIRNASKYDDIRFLHLPHLKMEWIFEWVCSSGANPHDHNVVMPCAPDKIEGDASDHDSYRYFRSRNIDLSISLDTRYHWREHNTGDNEASGQSHEERDKPEVLLYSTTLRWLSNFWYAVNAVARPICKGSIFKNTTPPKLKLSRHYRNVKLSFEFPQLKAYYWSSYAQQLGIDWTCGTGKVAAHFRLKIVPFEGDLIRRSMGEWSVISTTCDLSDTKIHLLKRQDIENDDQSPSNRSLGVERNFMLSLSKMSYRRDNVSDGVNTPDQLSPTKTASLKRNDSGVSRTSINEFDETKYRKKRQKKTTSPTKRPQNRHTLVVHDLRAMWTTDNRDVGYGVYEGYSKAAVMRRNLSTKVLSKIRMGSSADDDKADGQAWRRASQSTMNSDPSTIGSSSQKTMEPSEMLQQLLSEAGNKLVVGAEGPTTEQQKLKGIAACKMDDVVNKNWLIKFVNCQAMLKGPKTQGYIIMTAAQADFLNRDHKVMWRDSQLTTKSSWVGSLTGTQVFATVEKNATSSGKDGENVPWLSVSDIAPRGPSPGMLDISDLMGGGQAIGGVVGDGVSAGSFQLQRIVSRCTCRMYYVGYEALVDSEQSDYGQLLPETPLSPDEDKTPRARAKLGGNNLFGDEKPVNILTILQPDLEICTNTSQFTMIIDIVENLLLYVEPVMREHWERVDRMRFTLRLTSADDAMKHRDTLASMQNRIRARLTNMRQLERQLYRADRALDNDPQNRDLFDESANLQHRLAEEKETLNVESEELGIIIRCFKEIFLVQKTRNSSLRPQNAEQGFAPQEEDEPSVVRTTEVSFGQVKWHLTDEDGQLNIAQFEMRDFLYEKVNRSDETVFHGFEVAWLQLLNLLPNSLYRDVIKPRNQKGLRSYGVSGAGGRSLTLRVLCKVRPPVGGISVKDHVEVNAVPLTIQLTYQFFKRLMSFFFPDKGIGSSPDDDDGSLGYADGKDSRNANLLGLPSGSGTQERHGSIRSLPARPPPPSPSGSHTQLSTPSIHRRNRSSTKRDRYAFDATDDVDKMKERAAKNNSFLYIKITQVPLCVSYKGEKDKNIEDVHEFNVTIPMLEYHSMTWTWHDFAMAVKRDCKKQLVSQLIKEKLHISGRSSHHSATGGASEQDESSAATESNKAKLLLGNTLQRSDSHRKSLIFRKKKS